MKIPSQNLECGFKPKLWFFLLVLMILASVLLGGPWLLFTITDLMEPWTKSSTAPFLIVAILDSILVIILSLALKSGIQRVIHIAGTCSSQVPHKMLLKIQDWIIVMFFLGVSPVVYVVIQGEWSLIPIPEQLFGDWRSAYLVASATRGVLGVFVVSIILAFPAGYMTSMNPVVSGFLISAFPVGVLARILSEDFEQTSNLAMTFTFSEIISLPIIFCIMAVFGSKVGKPSQRCNENL